MGQSVTKPALACSMHLNISNPSVANCPEKYSFLILKKFFSLCAEFYHWVSNTKPLKREMPSCGLAFQWHCSTGCNVYGLLLVCVSSCLASVFVGWPDLTRWWLKNLTTVTCFRKSLELLCWGAMRRVGYERGCGTAGVGRWKGAAWVTLSFSLSPIRDFSFREVSAVLVWKEQFVHIREKIQSQRPYGGINEHRQDLLYVNIYKANCHCSVVCAVHHKLCQSLFILKESCPILTHMCQLYGGTSLTLDMWSVHTIFCPQASAEVLNYSLPQGVTNGCNSRK